MRLKEDIAGIAKLMFLYTIRFALGRLPLPAVHRLGDITGLVLVGEKGRIIREDLKSLLGAGESELDSIMRKTLQAFRKDLLEIWTFPSLNREKTNKMAYFEGLPNLDRALSKGKGAILCITHFGSWKMILPALGFNGYKVHQVAADPLVFVREGERFYHNRIMELEKRCESSLPAEFIYVSEKRSVRPIYRALERNEVVVLSLDGVISGKRMEMPFLNGSVFLSTSGASLSRTTGAPALPIFIVRQPDNRHKMIIHEPIAPDCADEQPYIKEWMDSFTEIFEDYVRRHPDHYARFLYTIRKYPISEVGNILKPVGR